MSKVKADKGETVVDFTIRAYGHLEGIINLCKDNGLALDHEELTAVERLIDDARKTELRSNRPLFPVVSTTAREQVQSSSGQNIVDLALQETGSVEGLVAFMRENGFSGLDGDVPFGTVIKTPVADIKDAGIRNFYKSTDYAVNTGEAALTDLLDVFDDTFDDTFM